MPDAIGSKGTDRIDGPALTSILDRCFDLSMDGDISPEQQNEFLLAGKRLRGYLLNLLSARFDQRTKQLETANRDLAQVNQTIQSDLKNVQEAAALIDQIANLVQKLDAALAVATKFV